jgi:hypothetical protein
MYKGIPETSFRLEYISSVPADYMKECALWIKGFYNQESVLLETYRNDSYKAELIFSAERVEKL